MPKDKKLFNRCERLWKEIVKLRAGHKSELSGLPADPAHPHHCLGKSTYALRFDIRGGMCITAGEHFQAHSTDNFRINEKIREVLKNREGKNIIEILEIQKRRTKINLQIVEMQLKEELKKLKEEL